VLSHAPRRVQSLLMMIDAFQVEGVTELAVDSIFMMPHLGVLSTVHPDAATEVFVKDCLIRLGTCVAPVGRVGRGKPLCAVELTMPGGARVAEELRAGALRRIDLGPGEEAKLVLQPAHGVDVGAGPGHRVDKTVRGGTCGLVFDGRGRRPLALPISPAARVAAASDWNRELQLYP
jgi:hypothetical protein